MRIAGTKTRYYTLLLNFFAVMPLFNWQKDNFLRQ